MKEDIVLNMFLWNDWLSSGNGRFSEWHRNEVLPGNLGSFPRTGSPEDLKLWALKQQRPAIREGTRMNLQYFTAYLN